MARLVKTKKTDKTFMAWDDTDSVCTEATNAEDLGKPMSAEDKEHFDKLEGCQLSTTHDQIEYYKEW